MIILAIDPSLNCTGWAVLDTSQRMKKKRIIAYGHIPNKWLDVEDTGLKLIHIEMIFKTLNFVFKPNVIVTEDLTGKAFNDLKQNSKAHGMVEKVFYGKNIVKINNKTFKKEFTGNGNATKDDVAKKCKQYIPDLIFKTDDESDACGIAIYYSMKLKDCKW